ncbi:MAG: fused DSP-PTPase phosphatase/NAD kinase-like protein [Candidatus Scalindua sp.]
MNILIRILSVACLTFFIAEIASADYKTMRKESFVRKVSSPLINLPNGLVPFENTLTGGQPTFDQLKKASKTDFKAVINLRTDGELPAPEQESTWVEGLGMKYFHIPVAGAEGLTLENTRLFAEVLSKTENYPLIVHCKSGNRVGALFALKAFYIDGKSKEEALLIGESAGLTSLAPAVRKILER